MRYFVVLPTRPLFRVYPLAAQVLPTLILGMDTILNPLLRELGTVEDIDVAGAPSAVHEYLCELFYEHSGNDTVDGIILSTPVWEDFVRFVSELYRLILKQRDTLLMDIPAGFISIIYFHRWVGQDMELGIDYTLYHPVPP